MIGQAFTLVLLSVLSLSLAQNETLDMVHISCDTLEYMAPGVNIMFFGDSNSSLSANDTSDPDFVPDYNNTDYNLDFDTNFTDYDNTLGNGTQPDNETLTFNDAVMQQLTEMGFPFQMTCHQSGDFVDMSVWSENNDTEIVEIMAQVDVNGSVSGLFMPPEMFQDYQIGCLGQAMTQLHNDPKETFRARWYNSEAQDLENGTIPLCRMSILDTAGNFWFAISIQATTGNDSTVFGAADEAEVGGDMEFTAIDFEMKEDQPSTTQAATTTSVLEEQATTDAPTTEAATTEAAITTEAAMTADATNTTEAATTTEAAMTADAMNATEAATTTEVAMTADTMNATEAATTTEAAMTADTTNTTEAVTTEAAMTADAMNATEAAITTEVAMTADATNATEAATTTEAAITDDATNATEAVTTTEAAMTDDVNNATEAATTTEAAMTADAINATEAATTTEATMTAEAMNTTEAATTTTEDEASTEAIASNATETAITTDVTGTTAEAAANTTEVDITEGATSTTEEEATTEDATTTEAAGTTTEASDSTEEAGEGDAEEEKLTEAGVTEEDKETTETSGSESKKTSGVEMGDLGQIVVDGETYEHHCINNNMIRVLVPYTGCSDFITVVGQLPRSYQTCGLEKCFDVSDCECKHCEDVACDKLAPGTSQSYSIKIYNTEGKEVGGVTGERTRTATGGLTESISARGDPRSSLFPIRMK